MLSNAYFLAKFRFDTAENEPAKNLQYFSKNAFSKNAFSKNAGSTKSAVDHILALGSMEEVVLGETISQGGFAVRNSVFQLWRKNLKMLNIQ